MQTKRQSYHDRYFAENQAVRLSANNAKGYKTVYQYVGLWKAWQRETGSIRALKAAFLVWEFVSICLYFGCASVNTPVNCSRPASGIGILSVIPWLLEVSGIARFIFSGKYVKELSMEEIDNSIRCGCGLRAVLVELSAIVGLANVILMKTMSMRDGVIFIGIATSGLISLGIGLCYRRLLVYSYRNIDGKPGNRI